MKIREVDKNKKQFISLLLLADEQENMIDRYIEKGTMYVLEDGNVKAECVVTDEDNGILEIKNIAVDPQNQGKGYGKALIDFLASKYADEYSVLQVGTGDSPLTIPFYEKCGFVRSHKIPNFFTDNYDHPIYEGGVQLIDMSEMTYRQVGDYQIPNLQLENEGEKTLGKYGRMRRAFLEQNNPMLLNVMILTESLFPHLWEIEETAKARVEFLMEQYLKDSPAPDKETQQMAWVQHMNSLKAQAEEVVMTELINS